MRILTRRGGGGAIGSSASMDGYGGGTTTGLGSSSSAGVTFGDRGLLVARLRKRDDGPGMAWSVCDCDCLKPCGGIDGSSGCVFGTKSGSGDAEGPSIVSHAFVCRF